MLKWVLIDLALGPYAKYGTTIKEYRNANMIYTPSEMVGSRRTGIKGIRQTGRADDNDRSRRAAEWHATGFF